MVDHDLPWLTIVYHGAVFNHNWPCSLLQQTQVNSDHVQGQPWLDKNDQHWPWSKYGWPWSTITWSTMVSRNFISFDQWQWSTMVNPGPDNNFIMVFDGWPWTNIEDHQTHQNPWWPWSTMVIISPGWVKRLHVYCLSYMFSVSWRKDFHVEGNTMLRKKEMCRSD